MRIHKPLNRRILLGLHHASKYGGFYPGGALKVTFGANRYVSLYLLPDFHIPPLHLSVGPNDFRTAVENALVVPHNLHFIDLNRISVRVNSGSVEAYETPRSRLLWLVCENNKMIFKSGNLQAPFGIQLELCPPHATAQE